MSVCTTHSKVGCGEKVEPQLSAAEEGGLIPLFGLQHGSQQDFLWRLARAYSDMCELAEEAGEKRSYALSGKC